MMQGNLFSTGQMPKPTKAGDIEPKAPQFYTKNWLPLPKSAVSMITAPGGAGKSFFSIQVACQVIKESPDRKVLLWLSEDPSGQSRKRLDDILSKVMKIGVGTNYMDNIHIIGSDSQTPHITIENLTEFQKMIEPYAVVILDPLIAFYAGEENSNSEARSFMNMFTHSAEKQMQSIVFVHHHTKGSSDNKSTTRGAGAFVDAVRAVYELEVIEDSRERKLNVTKDNWGVKMHIKSGTEFTVLPFEVVIEGEDRDKTPNIEEKTGGKKSLWGVI